MIKYFEILPLFRFSSLPWIQRSIYAKQDNYSVCYLIMFVIGTWTMNLLFNVMAKMRSISQYKLFKLQGFIIECIWLMQQVLEKSLPVTVQFNIASI